MSHARSLLVLVFLFSSCLPSLVHGQSERIADWTFHPNYTLARKAANYPGNKLDPPKGRFERFKRLGGPVLYQGQTPTQRISDLLQDTELPKSAFTLEMYVLNHVNQPVGTLVSAGGDKGPSWYLGYYDKELSFFLKNAEGQELLVSSEVKRGWKNYWLHVVAVFTGEELQLYVNGDLKGKISSASDQVQYEAEAAVELYGYFANEPFMEVPNLIKKINLYSEAWNNTEIADGFEDMQAQVTKGLLFGDLFHFTAGPYLNFARQDRINIVWETDRPTTAVIRYGTTLPLDRETSIDTFAYIHEITLKDLQVATPYYYEIEAIDENSERMKSSTLTFSTAVREDGAFSFCILGDTESRPHINQQLGKMVWEERPNFIMHLGDVTDGGKASHKFQWTQEYFTGITPVASRIPFFPVPGNGESDLYWYNRYHALPEPESYYGFTFGNAEFFMLNSNEKEELQVGGKQYEWLKDRISSSKAKWKFVAHHHCPISSDENDFGNTWAGKISERGDPRFDDLKKLYEDSGVDVVFYGHVHAYERSWPLKGGQLDEENGVIYLKSGGAGGNLEDFTPTRSYFTNKVQYGHHYCLVNIYQGKFSFKMFDLEGRLKDFFEIEK
ncbi:MAG: metallophosphoesterase [Saprospiraceae bacterium]|nr:metallophosphoesterase [Saprospiraceae bacterium]